MSTCQHCSAPAPSAFLCRTHVGDLHRMFRELAGHIENGRQVSGWIENLADSAHGATKMGGQNGRNASGDESPIRFNSKASELLLQVRGTLARWVLEMTEERGVEYRPVRFVRPNFIGPLRVEQLRDVRYAANGADLAVWLEIHCSAIVLSDQAGMCFEEVERCIEAIKHRVDLPTRRVWLGDCPTWHEETRTVCGASLWAPEDAIEVYCRECRSTHACTRLRLLQQGDLERTKVPWETILRANKSQPADRQIPERTLQSWRRGQDGRPPRLTVRGYRRPNGRVVPTRHAPEDVELYLWPDVRRLRDEKPQKRPTGAAARR